jgi:hypothetical protein
MEVTRLDDTLGRVDSDHPRSREFRDREEQIREDLVSLRSRVRRHEDNSEGLGPSKTEVEELRQDITSLRNDVTSSLDDTRSSSYSSSDRDVPSGTELHVRLDDSVSSDTSRPEQAITATVSEPLRIDADVVIPAGTEVRGIIRDVEPARRPSRGGRLELSFDSILLRGRSIPLQARVIGMEDGSRVDKRRAGLGALLGGVVGAVLDGKKGLLLGAIVGGGGSVAASAGEDVELPAGTLLTLRLDRALSVRR